LLNLEERTATVVATSAVNEPFDTRLPQENTGLTAPKCHERSPVLAAGGRDKRLHESRRGLYAGRSARAIEALSVFVTACAPTSCISLNFDLQEYVPNIKP
jgi:hypothetical protein